MSDVPGTGRVFISYAHDNDQHIDQVRDFYRFLRSCGVDADLDLPAGERRQDWATWMLRGVRDSRHVIVVASPAYKRRADGDAAAGDGAGVQWEARLLRSLVYEHPDLALKKIIPVVLPGGSPDDLPLWMGIRSHTYYTVEAFTVPGAERLLRLLTGQPYETVPELGAVPALPPREDAAVAAPAPASTAFALLNERDLVDALLTSPLLHRLDHRLMLLELMGDHLGLPHAFEVPESADARTHLRAIVRRIGRTAPTPDDALEALYFALEMMDPQTISTERVQGLLLAAGLSV